MSLAEIKQAVTELTPKELAELAAFIESQDKAAWATQIEEDFSPGGKHHEVLAKIDSAGSQEDWPEFPVFDGGPADGAIQHDKYIYDEPGRVFRRKRAENSRTLEEPSRAMRAITLARVIPSGP